MVTWHSVYKLNTIYFHANSHSYPMHIVLLLFLSCSRFFAFFVLPATRSTKYVFKRWIEMWMWVRVCLCHTQKVHIWISLHKKLDDLPQHDDTPQSTINCTDATVLLRIALCALNAMCIYLFSERVKCYFIEKLPFKFSFRKSDSNGVIECAFVCVRVYAWSDAWCVTPVVVFLVANTCAQHFHIPPAT